MSIDNNNFAVEKIVVSSCKPINFGDSSLAILWNSNHETDDFLNIYEYVEENSDRLREKYLRFISIF